MSRVSRGCKVWVLHLARLLGCLGCLGCLMVVMMPARSAESMTTQLARPIAAQPLARALVELADQTGLQVLYVSALAADQRSAPVPAGVSAPEALERLLAETGLTYEFLNARSVRLVLRKTQSPSSVTAPGLEDVVVVASSREQRLLEVPLSARVVSSAELEPFGLTHVDDVFALVPGLDYNTSAQWGSGLYSRVSMRGIVGERSGTTTVVYLDDTALYDALTPHSAFTIPYPAMFDLDRVEVLRGPQGVDFGAGAEGGAIRFVSKRANTTDSLASVSIEAGSVDQGGAIASTQAVIAQPLIAGRLGLRAGFYVRSEGGYVDRINPFTGSVLEANANRSSQRAARLALDYEATDQLSIQPTWSYQASRQHDSGVFYLGFSDPARGQLRNGKLLQQPYEDVLKVGALRIDQRWSNVTLTSVTSFIDRNDRAIVDQTNEAGAYYLDGFGDPSGPEVPVSYADAVTDKAQADLHMWSQEFRLKSADDGKRALVWSAGMYYADYQRTQSDRSYVTMLPEVAAISQEDWGRSREWSVFGQARWSLSSKWKLGAGIRVGTYEMSTTSISGGFFDPGSGVPVKVRNTGPLPVTPRVDVSYAITDQVMWFASAARGARVGRETAKILSCLGENAQSYYGSDSIWSYETGAKGSLFGDALSFDASVYDIEWRNIQMRTYDPCGHSYVINAGAVVSRGVDLAVQARLSSAWMLSLAVSTGDAHSRDTVYGLGGLLVSQRGAALAGVPDVPAPWSGTLSVQYTWALQADTQAVARVQWRVRSHHPGPFPELDPSFPTYDPRFAADPATQVGNVGLEVRHGRQSWRLYVDNVLNTHPVLQLSGDAPGTPLLYAYTVRPRTLGIALSTTF